MGAVALGVEFFFQTFTKKASVAARYGRFEYLRDIARNTVHTQKMSQRQLATRNKTFQIARHIKNLININISGSLASRTRSGGGESTVASVLCSNMGMVHVYLAVAKATEVGDILLPL
jgi:hypothetical protein